MSAADKVKLNGITASAKTVQVKTFSLDNQTITKGDNLNTSVTITQSGWTPIGVVAIDLVNATSSGQGVTYVFVKHWWLSGNQAGAVLRFPTENTGYANAKIKITFTILYIK